LDTTKYTPQAGDIVEVNGHRVGDVKRMAEVLEVLGEPDHRHYRVRWEDGHESIYFPGSDAIIRPRHPAHEHASRH
jgi:hypothetical protein